MREKDFLAFEEARDFVRSLGLKSQKEWDLYSKSGNRPDNIPSTPRYSYKNKGYISMGDWLGTGVIAPQLMNYLTYEEAKKFVNSLGLKNNKDWEIYRKSGNKPENIPASPERVYKKSGWDGLGDWLGTKKIANQNKKWRNFNEAREFTQTLNLKSQNDWRKYKQPSDIPASPDIIYKEQGWISWADFLGYEPKHNGEFLSYDECSAYAQNFGIKTQAEWKLNKHNLVNIPKDPQSYYKNKGWKSWMDFLGVNKVYNKEEFLTYEESKNYAQQLKLSSRQEWFDHCKSQSKPKNIPNYPNSLYHESWVSWSDFLGYVGKSDIDFLPFEEAREFVRSLNLSGQKDWFNYVKSEHKPKNIPSTPERVYKNKGWYNYPDWLGNDNISTKTIHKETNLEIYNFLLSIETQLKYLDTTDLVIIIQQAEGGYFYERVSKNIHFRNILAAQTDIDRTSAIQDLIEDYSNDNYIESDHSFLDVETIETTEPIIENTEIEPIESGDILQLTNKTIKQIQALDECHITASLDEEVREFFNKKNINELWNKYMNKELDLDTYINSNGGEFYENIKSQFIEEYNYLSNWDWQSQIENDIYTSGKIPNFMQKLFVKRVMENKDYGNWSGTGAGKTIGTILATKVLNCKNVIIITGNTIIGTWVKEINACFVNNNIMIKEKNPIFKSDTTNYLIYNYEFFSQPNSESIFQKILEDNVIDFIALDEVHFTKQRNLGDPSKRKQVILKLLSIAKQINPNIYKVAMSATPVVNNLVEAKMLLELLKLKQYNDLDTKETINNAIQIYKQLVINGIRYKPKYDIEIERMYVEINGEELIDRLSLIKKGDVVGMENVLLEIKLESVKQYIKKGTLIYTYYVENMVIPIKVFCEKLGYKVGIFTGDDKSGLEPFKEGKYDILIGSSAISTGVDGLQNVCDRIIPVCLPWTNADLSQLEGRIYRQGSKFGSVDIIIPQINIDLSGENWSWDEIRLDRIDSKKELSDCAVDGVIPSDKIMSRETLLNKAVQSLKTWKERIENGDILSIDRQDILFEFDPKKIEKLQKKLGDFSELNHRWSVSNSSTIKKKLDNDKEEWVYYHTLYKKARETWPEIPYIELSKKVSARPEWVIGDFGCGENLLSKEITNKVYAFDYVAIDENVIACDMSKVPLKDNMLDVAVFSLSLMGNNYEDYLKEAYRTLKAFGQLYICEPASKWKDREEQLKMIVESIGFRCFGAVRNSDKFIYIDGIKY